MPTPVNHPGPASPEPAASVRPALAPLSDDAFETSRLLLEVIHAAYASRGSATTDTYPAVAGASHGQATPSTHAIRAAIHVYQHGQRTVGELASGLGISYGWASRVITELEGAGMVVRQTDESDRRVIHVRLTPEAVEMAENAYRWRGEAVERALATLDADGRRAVATFLRRVTDELARAGHERKNPDSRGGRS